MADIDPRLEAACRAMCLAQGDDPDAEGRGLGHSMPLGSVYKLWEQRIPVARAIIDTWLQQDPTPDMTAASDRIQNYASRSLVYTAMCAHARKEIAGG